MRLDLLTAASINGIITEARGRHSHELMTLLDTPRDVVERKHEIRRTYDAGLVGTGTVLADDPTLTSHVVPGFEPIRITVDPSGRIPRQARFFDGSARTLVGVCEETPQDYLGFLAGRDIETVVAGRGWVDLAAFLDGLEERGIRSIACEGGGTLNRALLSQGLVERIRLLVIPLVLNAGSVNLAEGFGVPVRLRLEGIERQGEYVWMEYAVTSPPDPPFPSPSPRPGEGGNRPIRTGAPRTGRPGRRARRGRSRRSG